MTAREVDCPRCHEQCGWCSDYRWHHGTMSLPGSRRKCTVPGYEPEGDGCPLCDGTRRAMMTVTYAKGTSASGQDPQGLEAKPAGPVGNADAPKSPPNPEPNHD